jgi:tetratricopeptide (TPR) repeat protein
VARRGARAIHGDDSAAASEQWRAAVARSDAPAGKWEPDEVWILEPEGDDGRDVPARGHVGDRSGDGRRPAPGQGTAPASGHRRSVPRPVVDELAATAGTARGSKLAGRLAEASHAYERERYQEARRVLRPLAEEVPEAVAVQELYGLTLYRMGQWQQAAKHLELYRAKSGSYDQHPVLADCYRALRRYPAAERLWEELREASPSGELVAEGRIVAAGCRADQGDLRGAIEVLERTAKRVNHPGDHHLRQWYALADLYERAGDLPRARDLFGRIAANDADAFDVRQRLRALR